MLENQDILKRYLQEDEQILWSLRPFSRKYPIIDNTKINYSIILIMTIIILSYSFLHSLLAKNLFSSSITTIFILILLFYLLYPLFLIFSLIFGGKERQFLQNSEYFITNKQVFSIRLKKIPFLETKEIINLPLYAIEYYFIKLITNKPKPIYDIYFKIKFDTLEAWKDTILICKEMKDYKLKEKYPVLIKREEGWSAISLETIERLKHVYDIEKIKSIFNEKLRIKLQEPPIDWKRKWYGGDFHNPY